VNFPSRYDLNLIFGNMLSQHLRLNHFIETIQQMSTCLVSASIDLLFEIKQKNFPSVKKFHYFFTLNKMSILCQGLLHTKAESFCVGKQNSFIRLFVHEIYRVFTQSSTTTWWTTSTTTNCWLSTATYINTA
jgi:hypothetical protein